MERLTMASDKGGVALTFDLDVTCGKSEILKILKLAERLKYYEELEEQGLLPKLPCKVGDTVYFISEKVEKQGRRKITTEFVDKGVVDNITLGSTMIPQITVCDSNNVWITFDGIEDFGKTLFLTQDEAEEALKERRRA